MEYGPLIKYFRTQMKLTQKELAQGICSVSHLSKIENNGKDANIETIKLLFEKLKIDKGKINEKEERIKSLLSALNEKMLFFQKNEVDYIFGKLAKMGDIIPYSTALYTFELYKFRYFLFKGKLKEAKQQENLLYKQRKNFSQQENDLFQHYIAICLILQGQYGKADNVLEMLMAASNHEYVAGELLYHRALVKSCLEYSDHAIYFGKKALQAFMNEHNLIRVLHTLMLLGINYTYTKIYEEALGCFKHLMRNAELLNESEILPQIYHNIGYLKTRMEKYSEALYFYEKSLSQQPVDSPHYLVTLYTIGESYYSLGKTERATEVFESVLILSKKYSNQKYILLSKYYLKLISTYSDAFEFLEMKVIPYLEESKEHPDTLNRFYRLLSTHYRQLAIYEKAVRYIEKIS
jgi:HTH-type transcriptional regulator, quorum sensing regulator NprR